MPSSGINHSPLATLCLHVGSLLVNVQQFIKGVHTLPNVGQLCNLKPRYNSFLISLFTTLF